jgi:hypothetical protein
MLHKCANSCCSNLFRRLSEGKLFQVETEYFDKGVRGNGSGAARTRARRRVEYFWLCEECASFLSLTFDKAQGVITVPLADASGKKTVTALSPRDPSENKMDAVGLQTARP